MMSTNGMSVDHLIPEIAKLSLEESHESKRKLRWYVGELSLREERLDGIGDVEVLPSAEKSPITKLAEFIPGICGLEGDEVFGLGETEAPRDQLHKLYSCVQAISREQDQGAIFMMQVSGGGKTRLAAQLGMSRRYPDVFVVLGVIKSGRMSPLTAALEKAVTDDLADPDELCHFAVLAFAEVAVLAAESSLLGQDEAVGEMDDEQIVRGQQAAVLAMLPVRDDCVGKRLAAEIFGERVRLKDDYPLDCATLKRRLRRWLPEGKGRIVLAMDEIAYLRNQVHFRPARKINVYHSVIKACSTSCLDVNPLFIGNFLDLHANLPKDMESPIRGPVAKFYPVAITKVEHMIEALHRHINPCLELDGSLRQALGRLEGRPVFFFDYFLRLCCPGMKKKDVIRASVHAANQAKDKILDLLDNAWASHARLRPVIGDALVAILLSSSNPTVTASHLTEGELVVGLGLFAARKHDDGALWLLVHQEPILCDALVEWYLNPRSVPDGAPPPNFKTTIQQILSVSASTIDLSASEKGARLEPLLALAITYFARRSSPPTLGAVLQTMLSPGFELHEMISNLPFPCTTGRACSTIARLDSTCFYFGIDDKAGPDGATAIGIRLHRVPVYFQCKAKTLRSALPTVHRDGLFKSNTYRNNLANQWFQEYQHRSASSDDTSPLTPLRFEDLEFISVIFSAAGFRPEALEFFAWWNSHPVHRKHPIIPLQSTREAFDYAHSIITDGKGLMSTLGPPKKSPPT